tara:strand:+ start:2105 stop:2344 length:240 start_codon:yes stop_codon:yes gene_type:complete
MKVKQIINSNEGKYIISIILGLGLATMFREVCKDKTCIQFRAIGENEIKDKVYKHDNKCYKYSIKSTSCNNKKQKIDIA